MFAPPGEPADKAPAAPTAGAGENITDDEFEALLDQLHGKGQFAGAPADEEVPAPEASAGSDDLITDDEFESLLDQLHGKGGSPTAEYTLVPPVLARVEKGGMATPFLA